MSDAEWLDAFDERLEEVTERWMHARWADFTQGKGDPVGALQRERGALLTDGRTRESGSRRYARGTLTPGRVDVLERAVLQATIDGDLARVARDLVRHVCAPGNLVDWNVKIERLTGRPPSADAWVRELEAGAAL